MTLLLGTAALIAKIAVASTVIRREVPLTIAAVVLFAVLAKVGLTMIGGIILLAAAGATLWLLVRWAGEGRSTALATETLEYAEISRPVPAAPEPGLGDSGAAA